MLKTWRAVHPTDKQAVANDAGFTAVVPDVFNFQNVALEHKGRIRKIQTALKQRLVSLGWIEGHWPERYCSYIYSLFAKESALRVRQIDTGGGEMPPPPNSSPKTCDSSVLLLLA